MEPGATSPDVQEAWSNRDYTSSVQAQIAVLPSGRRGESAPCRGRKSIFVVNHHHLGSGRTAFFTRNFLSGHGEPDTFDLDTRRRRQIWVAGKLP